MLNMSIKVDVWSKGLEESFRESIRENVRDLFCQLPVRRVWYYLKRIRHMILRGPRVDELEIVGFEDGKSLDGPEDIIAKGKIHYWSLRKTL
jgi:hypothetical protein